MAHKTNGMGIEKMIPLVARHRPSIDVTIMVGSDSNASAAKSKRKYSNTHITSDIDLSIFSVNFAEIADESYHGVTR